MPAVAALLAARSAMNVWGGRSSPAAGAHSGGSHGDCRAAGRSAQHGGGCGRLDRQAVDEVVHGVTAVALDPAEGHLVLP